MVTSYFFTFPFMTKHTLEHITPEEYDLWRSEIKHDLAFSTKESKRISLYMDWSIKVTTEKWVDKKKNIIVHIDTPYINDAIDVYNSL